MSYLRTLTGQLIALFLLVLLVSQAVNVFLIVGERRVSTRSVLYDETIEMMGARVALFQEGSNVLAPDRPRPGGGRGLRLFVGPYAYAMCKHHAVRLPSLETKLLAALQNRNIAPLDVYVSRFQRRGPRPPGPRGNRPLVDECAPTGAPPHLQDALSFPKPPPPADPSGPPGPGHEQLLMSVQLAEKLWINGVRGHYPLENLTPRILMATLGVFAIGAVAVAVFARRLSRPLAQLADAADHFGHGVHVDKVNEDGPHDVRQTIIAFNRMQQRLTRMIETQRIMLRAVGHDLRTPLTSLRIRAESVEPEQQREKMIATIDETIALTEEILQWTKDAASVEEMASVDLCAMLSSITDDYVDQGKDVTFDDCEQLVIKCRRMALKRVFRNIIDNALSYGKCARMSFERHADQVAIYIDDEGPGIPNDQLEDVLKPFVRLEGSRSKDTGGAGLGLSIVDTIVRAHGGTLSLKNRSVGGLRVQITLPLGGDVA